VESKRADAQRLGPSSNAPPAALEVVLVDEVARLAREYVRVAVDDASRLAYVEVLEDQKGLTAGGLFERAGRWFVKRRIAIERVMTDNGSAYVSRPFRQACKRWSIRHLRTRPYRPETYGKAERKTLIRGWA